MSDNALGSEYVCDLVLTGNVGAEEVLESSGVVEVEMSHDDGFDVVDVVAGGFDGVRELHLLGIGGARKDIGKWSTPFLSKSALSGILYKSCISLTTSRSSPQPVSKSIRPSSGCSMRAAMTIRSRRLLSGFSLLKVLVLAPRKSLRWLRHVSHWLLCLRTEAIVCLPAFVRSQVSQVQDMDFSSRRALECRDAGRSQELRDIAHDCSECTKV